MAAIPQTPDFTSTSDQEMPTRSPPARLLRLPEVMARVGLKRSAIYQRMSEGRFPRSRSLGPKCVVWVDTEIDEWIHSIAETSGCAHP